MPANATWKSSSPTYLLAVFSGHCPLLLHDRLLLEFAVISDIRDDLTVLLDSESLRIICHLRKLPLRLLELGMIFNVTLYLRVLRDTLQLRCLRHRGGFGFWYMPAEKKKTKTFVTNRMTLLWELIYSTLKRSHSRSI